MTDAEIRQVVRQKVAQAGTVLALCRELKVHDSTIYNLLAGRKMAGPRVLAKLGLVATPDNSPVTPDNPPEAPDTTPYTPMWRLGDWPVFRRRKRTV